MPRKNNQTYLAQRAAVQRDWFDHGARSMSLLTTSEQRDLHDYFATTRGLLEPELIDYRKRVSVEDPSLPQRAGRAFVQFEHVTRHPSEFGHGGSPTGKGRTVVVRPVLHPHRRERERRLTQALVDLYFNPEMQNLLDKTVDAKRHPERSEGQQAV